MGEGVERDKKKSLSPLTPGRACGAYGAELALTKSGHRQVGLEVRFRRLPRELHGRKIQCCPARSRWGEVGAKSSCLDGLQTSGMKCRIRKTRFDWDTDGNGRLRTGTVFGVNINIHGGGIEYMYR